MLMPHNLISLLSAAIYVAAYGAITIYSLHVNEHRDLCPFYALVTAAAAAHVTVVTIHTWERGGARLDHEKPHIQVTEEEHDNLDIDHEDF